MPQKLKGKTFVLTGTLEKLTRDTAKEKIRALGGDVSSSVSKNIDFVVVGKNPGSKLYLAQSINRTQSINIKIITENQFLKILNISN